MMISGEELSGVGDQGELWLASRLPRGWVWQPPRRDVGKDGLVVIRDGSELQNVEFSLQVKSTTAPTRSGHNVVVKNVSRSSILYWHASTHPTLIVAVDVSAQQAWYVWHFDAFEPSARLLSALPEQSQIKVPVANVLDSDAWGGIRADLKRCYSYIWNSTSKSDSFVWIVASVGILSTTARNLVVLADTKVPEEPLSRSDVVGLLIEQRLHRNALAIAHKARGGLSRTVSLHRELGDWSNSYHEVVRRAFPELERSPGYCSNAIGRKVGAVLAELAETRRTSLMLIFDLIALLTRIHPSGSHNEA